MSLHYPLVLALIPVVIWLLFLALRVRNSTKVLFFPIVHRHLSLSAHLRLPIWLPFTLRALAFTAAFLALARPQTSSSQTQRTSEGIDIMIAFDVSQSMLIQDMGGGKNRLNTAKETVHKFIEGRKDDRIGFSVFSGEAITLCPPTLDYEFLHAAVNQADVSKLRDGTAIGDGLATALNRLKESTAKTRIVILITDGDNNMGAIAPLTAGDIAVGYGVKVYGIALGTEGIVSIPGMNIFGQQVTQQVVSSINPSLLMKISDATGGKFYRAGDPGSLQRIFADIDKLERSKVEKKDRVLYSEYFQPLLLLAILFFFADLILRSTIFRVLPE